MYILAVSEFLAFGRVYGKDADIEIVIFRNKRSQAKVSTMYFYIDSVWTIYTHR